MAVDLNDPFTIIAQDFMARKGYPDILPHDVETLDDDDSCRYFYYRLPEGVLELEVTWNSKAGTWDTLVTAFNVSE